MVSSLSYGCGKGRAVETELAEIVVVLSPNDCINCSATLYTLVKNNLPFHFMVGKYSDIAILKKVLGVNYTGYEIMENPKLYKALCPSGLSSVTLMKNGEVVLQRGLKNIDEIVELAKAMFRGAHRAQSYQLPEGINLSSRIQLCASEAHLNILDEFTGTIYRCKKANEEFVLEYTIELVSISIKNIYVAKTGDTVGFHQFDMTRQKFAKYNPNSLQIKHLNTSSGALFASVELQYPRLRGNGEIRFEPSFFIAEIVDGGIGEIKHIARPFDDGNFPRVDEAFYVDSSRVFTFFNSKPLHEYSGEECHKFLIKYETDLSTKLTDVAAMDFCLPSYWKDYGLTSLTAFLFDENIGYFMHFPWFVIENDNSWIQVVIHQLHIDYTGIKEFPPEKGIIINSVYFKNSYLYVFYYNQEDLYYKELVYSIVDNKVISDANFCKYPDCRFNGQLQYDQHTGAIWAINIEDKKIHCFY
ncbi:MAG: hypothetical protein HYZ16_00425 [Bacteroidetes bacterium]|nr:hypothetical protein [Bacteroidota bacterium]